jgi:protein TonB
VPNGAKGVGNDRIGEKISKPGARRWKRGAVAGSVLLHVALVAMLIRHPDTPPSVIIAPDNDMADISVTLSRSAPKPPAAATRPAQPEPAPHPTPVQSTAMAPQRPMLQPRPRRHPAPETSTTVAASSPTPAPQAEAAVPAAPREPPLILHPRFRTPPVPAAYPQRAMELNQQGDVLVRAIVNPKGEPEAVNLWRSSGFPMLDEAALEAIRRWRFLPAEIDGVPVRAIVQVPVVFHLK